MAGNPPPGGNRSFDNFEFTFERVLDGSEAGKPHMDDTESLTESVTTFPEEHGRTYHSYRAGSYPYPNDEEETDRLDFQYVIFHNVFQGRLYFAPWTKSNPPERVLDIATGTGQWAIDMGDEFPESEIIATDLSPIQPEHVPPNVQFVVEDAMETWQYAHPFAYVHTRMTLGCWADFTIQIALPAFENLVPGGYLESQELDPTIHISPTSPVIPSLSSVSSSSTITPSASNPSSAISISSASSSARSTHPYPPLSWLFEVTSAAEDADRPLCFARTLRQSYESVGFVDVQERVFRIPLNMWGEGGDLTDIERETGRLWEKNMVEGVSGFSLGLLTRFRGRTREEVELMLVEVRRGISDQSVHAYQNMHVVWGRKPFDGETTSVESTAGTEPMEE